MAHGPLLTEEKTQKMGSTLDVWGILEARQGGLSQEYSRILRLLTVAGPPRLDIWLLN